jgi:hypothetical protein
VQLFPSQAHPNLVWSGLFATITPLGPGVGRTPVNSSAPGSLLSCLLGAGLCLCDLLPNRIHVRPLCYHHTLGVGRNPLPGSRDCAPGPLLLLIPSFLGVGQAHPPAPFAFEPHSKAPSPLPAYPILFSTILSGASFTHGAPLPHATGAMRYIRGAGTSPETRPPGGLWPAPIWCYALRRERKYTLTCLFTQQRRIGILRTSPVSGSRKFAPDFGKCNHALVVESD